MNNLPKVVTQQRRGRDSNPRLLDRKSDALPLSHRATETVAKYVMYRLSAIAAILFYWITMKAVQQLTGVT